MVALFFFFCQIIDKISSFVRIIYIILADIKNQYLKIKNIRSIILLRCFDWVVVFMKKNEQYKKEILEMVNNIKNKDILIYIYNITKDIIKEDTENE